MPLWKKEQNGEGKSFCAVQWAAICFCWLFAASMALFLAAILRNNHPAAILISYAAAIAGGFAVCCMGQSRKKVSERYFWIGLGIALLLYFAICFYTASSMRIALPSDTDIVYESIADLLEDGKLNRFNPKLEQIYYPGIGLNTNADYFCRCYNNIGLLLLLSAVYAVGGIFGITAGTGEGQTLAIGFTSLCVTLTVLFLCLIVRLVFKKQLYVVIMFGLCAAFTPFCFSVPNFYTDILVIPFTVIGVWLFLMFAECKKYAWLLGSAAAFFVATQMKITAAIAIVALALYWILGRFASPKKTVLALAVFLGLYGALMLLFSFWYHRSAWFDFSRNEQLYMPAQLWLCFGSHGNGSYSYEDALYAASIPTIAERSQALWQRVADYYQMYTPPELLRMEYTKLLSTWNDPHFDSTTYTLWPLNANWTAYFTQPTQRGYFYSLWFSRVYLLMLYLFCGASALLQVLRKKIDSAFLCNLMMFGTILYLLLFETAPRRAMIAIPFLMLNVIYVLDAVVKYAQKRKEIKQ